ncbi:MAG: hypothetical protein NE328_01290 [Lentisphaeraceae bacterium]|nr:hypothetical protein [Lentisphaeraceae bacterium]
MKPNTIIFVLLTAATVFLVTSTSQKTTGKVPEYAELSLPELKEDSQLIEDTNTPQTLEDLSLPQLLALDPETVDFINTNVEEFPEESAEWALKIENDFARYKVLKTVLYKWADQSPKTCAFWVEQMPAFDKNLDLYITVARSWASNAPTSAMEEYRSLDKKTNKEKYGKFVTPLTKAVLEVWAEKSPDLAASWVTQTISNQNERNEYYPVIMHAWFKNSSPKRLFSWLIQFKYDETADLDSVFLMQEWVMKDSQAPFEWLSSQLKNDYIDELTRVASDTLAQKDLKACETLLNEPKMAGVKNSLVEAITFLTAGKDDKKALESISKLSDLELADSICTRSAMELAGKDDDAILYVKATGFFNFPKLNDFFLDWAEVDSRKVLNWLKTASYHEFSTDYFTRLVREWNLDSSNSPISKETVESFTVYLKSKPSLTKTEIVFTGLPPKLVEEFQKQMSQWSTKWKEIIEDCAAQWAKKNYEESLSYAMADPSITFTSVCLRGILPLCPEKSFDNTIKKIDQLKDSYPKQELFSYLALSKAEQSPSKTFELLKKKGILDSTFVIQAIDLSITHKREELNKVLEKVRTSNMHIYYPYFFYQYTRLDPNNSYKALSKYSRKAWHNSALKAVAASYKDYHPNRLKNWYKNLNSKDKEMVSDIFQ